MNYSDFRHKVKPGHTIVICPKIATDMPQGWDEAMDDMVGIPLLVEEIAGESVVLMHPDGDEDFKFGYRYVVLANTTKKIEVSLNNYKFLIYETISSYVLSDIILGSDRLKLFKLLGINEEVTNITISSDNLKQIQETCPRIIGALLSNNIMERIN